MWVKVVRFVCVVWLLVASAQPTDTKRIPRWWMKVAQRQGPNACVVEEVPNTGLEFWTECRYWVNRRVCGRRTRMRFECCEGFERDGDENGCTRVKPLVNLVETVESLGATKWAQYIRQSGLAGELQSAAAYTLFAPTDEAFENVRGSLWNQMEAYRGIPNNPVILYHLLPTKLLSNDFQADLLVETRHQGHSVRINKYSNGMTTVNCALLNRKDQHATNGVVHLISNILDPSIGVGQNVVDMVLNDGRFSVLADVLQRSGYINVLRTMQGSVTVLAPSDEAFQKLSESRREKIINDSEARLALVQNHIIPHVICESAVTDKHKVSTVSRDGLNFSCDPYGTYVESTKLRGNFNLGRNGIIHMIDDVLLPDRAKNLLELAESRHLYTFVDMVKRAGLEETLSHTGDYTFFVPDEASWYALDSQVLEEARRDLDLAGQLVRFHGAYGRHLTNAITDNQAIMSLNEEDPVRLQVWRRALGVEDARITVPDLEAQNGVIHIINKVITPSNQSLYDVLRSLPEQRFETFLEAVGRVSQEGEEGALLSLGPGVEMFYTFFVPTDSAFRRVEQAMLRRLREDDPYTRQTVKQHVAVNMFPETSFEKNLVYTVNGMAGPFDVKKTRDDVLMVNGEEITSSHLCANGVIHIINNAFMPQSTYISSKHGVSYTSYGEGGGGGGSHIPSRTSTRKTYKQTVTFAERYNGGKQELPGVPQGSVKVSPSKVTRRKEAKRRRVGSSSSSFSSSSPSSTTSPPPADASFISSPSLSSPTEQDGVEETHIESTRLEAREDEAKVNSLSGPPGGSRTPYGDTESYNEPGLRDRLGSRPKYPKGSYSVREGSYSSSSYKPSSTPSSTTTTTTYPYSSSSIPETREEEVQSVDALRRGDSSTSSSSTSSSTSSRRRYDLDLHANSSLSSSSSSSPHSSTSRRRYNPKLDGDSSPSSSSSSSSSSPQSSTSRRRYNPKLDGDSSPSSSISSSISSSSIPTSRRYDPDLDHGSPKSTSHYPSSPSSSSSSSTSFTPSYRRDPDLDIEPSSSSSSSSFSHSITGTKVEAPSGTLSPLPIPPRLPDGQGSSGGFLLTNHTRHSSQAGATSSRFQDATELRGASTTSLKESSTNLRGSETNLRGSTTYERELSTRLTGTDLNIRGPSTYIRGSSPDTRRGSSNDVRDSIGGSRTISRESSSDRRGLGTEIRGSEVRTSSSNVKESNTFVRESSSDVTESSIDINGSNTAERGSSTSERGSSTDIRGSSNYIRGSDIRGSKTNVRGSGTDIREPSTDVRGSNTVIRGSGSDIRGSGTDISGSSSDIRGSSTDVRGSDINESSTGVRGFDINGSNTGVRESGTDIRKSHTNIRKFKTDESGSSPDERGSSTDIRGSSTDIRGSSTDIRGSSTDIRGSSTDITGSDIGGFNTVVRVSGTDIKEPSNDVRRSSTGVRKSGSGVRESGIRRSSTKIRGSNTNRRGYGTNITGSSTDVSESSTGIRGSGTNVRGSGTNIRGSGTNIRGSGTNIRGSGTNIRGSNTDIRGSSTDIRGSSTDIRGSNTDITESSTDIRGSSTDIRGSITDIRGSSTDITESSTDIRRSSTDTRGSSTDVRGSSTVVGESSAGLQREVDTRVGGPAGLTTSSSKTYSYQYNGGASGLEAGEDQDLSRQPYGPGTPPSTNTPSSRPSPPAQDNTGDSANPGSRRFSYVGHSYGQDVVGHTDQLTSVTRPSPLPYRIDKEGRRVYGREAGMRSIGKGAGSVRALEGVGAGAEGVDQSVYEYSKTSHMQQHLQSPSASLHSASSGRSTTTIGSVRSSRRRYNITKTSYSYSVPVVHPRLPPPIRSTDKKLKSLSPVAQYAFTEDEDMYADGTEFAEMEGVGVNITRQEARELRRRFRKKRHHKRRGGGKGRRRRGKRGRRNRVAEKVADAHDVANE